MVFTTIVFSFGDDWFSSLPGKTDKGLLWHPFQQDSHEYKMKMLGTKPIDKQANLITVVIFLNIDLFSEE